MPIQTNHLFTMTMKQLFLSLFLTVALTTHAADAPEWRNPQVNQQNREARRANFFAFEHLQG